MAEAQHMHRPCARMDSRQCGGGGPAAEQGALLEWRGGDGNWIRCEVFR